MMGRRGEDLVLPGELHKTLGLENNLHIASRPRALVLASGLYLQENSPWLGVEVPGIVMVSQWLLCCEETALLT